MSNREIKVTVEHEPGCILIIVIGILLGVIWNIGGCTVNIGSETNTIPQKQMITPRVSAGSEARR